MQEKIGGIVARELSAIIGSEVRLEKVDLGLFNRIQIQGVRIADKENNEIAKINRLSASFDILPLFKKKIRINTVQLFGFDINLEKKDKDAPLNIKYIIDAFKSKEKKEKSPIDLRVNYVLLRNGSVSYDILSEDSTAGLFNTSHLDFNNISANISLKALNKDSVYLYIKRLAFRESNGLEMKKMSMRLRANKDRMLLDDFAVQLRESELKIDSVWVEDQKGNLMNLEPDSIVYGMSVNNSEINIGELDYFFPFFDGINRKVNISLNVGGTQNTLELRKLLLKSDSDFRLDMVSALDSNDISFSLREMYIGKDMLMSIPNIRKSAESGNLNVPDYIRISSRANGAYSNIRTIANISSSIGTVSSEVSLAVNRKGAFSLLGGKVKSEKLLLGDMLPKSGLGETGFNLIFKTKSIRNISMANIYMKGNVSRFDYKGYTYQNIKIDGGYNQGKYNGKLVIDDRNGYLDIEGSYNGRARLPELDINATLRNIALFETGIVKNEKYENSKFSFNLTAKSVGNDIDNFKGFVEIDNFDFSGNEGNYYNKGFRAGAENISDSERKIYISSDFLNAEVRGNFTYKYLVKSIESVAKYYMPVLNDEQKNSRKRRSRKKTVENNFSFELDLENTEFVQKVLMLPLRVDHPSSINGYFNEKYNRFALNAFIPDLSFGDKYMESSSLSCNTTEDEKVSVVCRTNLMMKNYSMLGVSLYSTLGNNQVNTELYWGNNQKETYGGNLNAVTSIERVDKRIKTSVSIKESDFILKDSLWNIYPAEIVADSGRISISHLRVEHLHQFIDINGVVSPFIEDSLFIDLNDIDLRYIFELANIRHVVDLSGKVSGNAYGNGVLKEPRINADLYVDNFSFNDSRLGDMKIKGLWNNADKGIHIDADIRDKDISQTSVFGVIYPIKPGAIDLRVKTSHVDLGFLRKYMAAISSDTRGRASGEIRIHGPFTGINLTGSAAAEDFRFKVDILNTYICSSDTVHFLPDRIFMDNILVTDAYGNGGRATVSLPHENLKDLKFNVNASLYNMLVLNTKETPDLPFYGKIYASGFLSLNGGPGYLNVDADVRTEANSSFAFALSTTTSATSNQFVTFVDKTKYWRADTLYVPQKRKLRNDLNTIEQTTADTRLNLNIDVNPNVYLKLIMDPSSGDYIGGNGSGNIKVNFYNKGDVKMYGNYTINQGVYKFSLQEIIRKDFIIKAGSNVTFNGNPLDAILDINAIYTVNSVPLQDLGADVASQAGQSNVKVNCTMNLSGELTKPDIKLGLELPNEGEEVERTVLNAISTEEQMNMQILYLLGIGKFYMQDFTGEAQNSNALSSVLSSTISGQLNNIFSNLINSNNLNIGTNLSTGVNGWTDMEFEGMLSGQLLNNRLLINGNFGYRDNALSQSNFIGDFEVEYLLTKSGNLRIKAYTKTNDRYYTKTTLTTQGLGFIFKRDFNNWRDFFGIERPDRLGKEGRKRKDR